MSKKVVFSLLALLFPMLAWASSDASSFTFHPPPNDFSVFFLSNIFGVVDGVLGGTGSQIMGVMFKVFNAAVLALGAIVITYTLLVSTMNTAHEGQMLGQKWSSLWVPVRVVSGMALLIPKASGYCLMQIAVMWVVVQGVGAADKIWEATLSYLNRGGAIIRPQMTPENTIDERKNTATRAVAAGTMLAGQVCMIGLQNILTQARQKGSNNPAGACKGTPSAKMQLFCNTAVPDFASTVNVIDAQMSGAYSVKMPNFKSPPYNALNGICGTLAWNPFTVDPGQITLTPEERQATSLARATAIQQMYLGLQGTAAIMVNNSPLVMSKPDTKAFSPNAMQQFGVPLYSSNQFCTKPSSETLCTNWGSATGFQNNAPLFSGTEMRNAISAYNTVMQDTLTLITEARKNQNAKTERAFIETATQQGWMMAGSYFFDLARLNNSAMIATGTDSNAGLEKSAFDAGRIKSPFGSAGGSSACTGEFADLCVWLSNDRSQVDGLMNLLNGSNVGNPLSLPRPSEIDPSVYSSYTPQDGRSSSTVFGFINNAMVLYTPGQPGMKPPKFEMNLNLNLSGSLNLIPEKEFEDCGFKFPPLIGFCVGRWVANMLYNWIFRNIMNFFLGLVIGAINSLVFMVIALPLQGIAGIFRDGVSVIQQPTVNPIIALANMGAQYVNYAHELWLLLLTTSIILEALFGPLGILVMTLFTLAAPMLFAWMGIMLSVGFITAYYVPFVPYMIFTFATIAWLIVVIEAMVAAPIVALAVTHPEGHEVWGKGDQAIMILMNVFLRPAMMIIGYIAGIALSYVSVWIINAGFGNVVNFIQGTPAQQQRSRESFFPSLPDISGGSITNKGYTNWAGIYGFFFSVLMYTTLYLIVVQRAFTLITYLPDKVLRWIGGQAESIGQETAQWGEEAKGKMEKAEQKSSQAVGQTQAKLKAGAGEILARQKQGAGGFDLNLAPDAKPDGGGGGGGGG